MFGLKLVTQKMLRNMETDAHNKAVAELVELLRGADKIFTAPVTIKTYGDNQSLTNCVFLGINGTALTIVSKE